jgi:hypothetical protein
MAARRNAAAQELRTPKYRPRIVRNVKKAYSRRPKHPARAADAFSGRLNRQAPASDGSVRSHRFAQDKDGIRYLPADGAFSGRPIGVR